ncbi:hypothetical protein LCGC14_0711020 [marine sediment metagenome]|uniref:M23ase beta-sheet core domain-containing protein n=1 Tax=marine sediment metagenome TaxID=412755 RepID=A0A0F9QEY3_9ZZZZ
MPRLRRQEPTARGTVRHRRSGRRDLRKRILDTKIPVVAIAPIWPVPGGTVSQGVVPGHRAIDISAVTGTPVFAVQPGRVTAVFPWSNGKWGYGRNVRVRIANGIEAIYAHLQNYAVKVGDVLRPGQQIGTVGATGTGIPHLHLEYRRPGRDVWNGQWSTTTAVDPLPFLSNAIAGAAVPVARVVRSITSRTSRPSVSISPVNDPRADVPPDKETTASRKVGVIPGVAGDILGLGIGAVVEDIKPKFERLAYGTVGLVLIVVGLIIIAISFRGEIKSAATYTADILKPVTDVVPG